MPTPPTRSKDDYLLWGYTGGHDSGALPPSVSGSMTSTARAQGSPWPLPPGRLRRALPADGPVQVGRVRRRSRSRHDTCGAGGLAGRQRRGRPGSRARSGRSGSAPPTGRCRPSGCGCRPAVAFGAAKPVRYAVIPSTATTRGCTRPPTTPAPGSRDELVGGQLVGPCRRPATRLVIPIPRSTRCVRSSGRTRPRRRSAGPRSRRETARGRSGCRAGRSAPARQPSRGRG